MTYCVAIQVADGLVFAADTRTAAGVEDVRTYNKLHAFEFPGDRVCVMLSAGNLATTQAVLAQIQRDLEDPQAPVSLRSVPRLHDAAEYVGRLSVRAQKQSQAEGVTYGPGVDFRATLIIGGQIGTAEPAVFLVYPEGNCITSSPESPYLQIGEHKYGKPILDRIIRAETKLEEAARTALVSLDSTMKSNFSVGPPVDLAIVPKGALAIAHRLRLYNDTPYFAELRAAWSRNIQAAVRDLPRFDWEQPPQLQQAAQAQQSEPHG